MKEKVSWFVMFVLAIILIAIGIQGAAGRVLACFVTPQEVVINAS